MALNGTLYQFVRDTCTLCVCDKERETQFIDVCMCE